jgi:hypothetical protein
MIFFDVLSTKQPLLCPEVPIRGMLIALNQQQCWRCNALRLNILTGCGYRFVFTTLDAVLGNELQDAATL